MKHFLGRAGVIGEVDIQKEKQLADYCNNPGIQIT